MRPHATRPAVVRRTNARANIHTTGHSTRIALSTPRLPLSATGPRGAANSIAHIDSCAFAPLEDPVRRQCRHAFPA